MSAPVTTSAVAGTAVRVSITVTVGEDVRTFDAQGVLSDGGDPYRLARSMTFVVRDEAADYLMERER